MWRWETSALEAFRCVDSSQATLFSFACSCEHGEVLSQPLTLVNSKRVFAYSARLYVCCVCVCDAIAFFKVRKLALQWNDYCFSLLSLFSCFKCLFFFFYSLRWEKALTITSSLFYGNYLLYNTASFFFALIYYFFFLRCGRNHSFSLGISAHSFRLLVLMCFMLLNMLFSFQFYTEAGGKSTFFLIFFCKGA